MGLSIAYVLFRKNNIVAFPLVLEKRVRSRIFKNMPDLQFIISWSYQNCAILKRRDSTGCPDQIVPSVNLILLPYQKTCRKCKDSFGIVNNRAKKYVISYYDLRQSLDPSKWGLVLHGVLQARRNNDITR